MKGVIKGCGLRWGLSAKARITRHWAVVEPAAEGGRPGKEVGQVAHELVGQVAANLAVNGVCSGCTSYEVA